MNQLQIFQNEQFGEIRTVIIEDKPYFVGKDIAAALGYKNTTVALQDNVDEEDKVVTKVSTFGGEQDTAVINESGLYALVFGSRLKTAKEFKRWVTSEVLPSIRKHGGYIANQESLTNEQILANAYVLAQKIMAEKDKQLLVQRQQLVEMTPKATYYDRVLQTPSLMTTKQVASDYGMTAQKLNNLLHELGVQYKQSGVWLLYSKYLGYGYTQTKTHTYTDSYGREQSKVHTYWTQKGRLFIYDLLKSQGILPTIEQEEIA